MRINYVFSLNDLNVVYDHRCGSRIYIYEHGFWIFDQKNDAAIGWYDGVFLRNHLSSIKYKIRFEI